MRTPVDYSLVWAHSDTYLIATLESVQRRFVDAFELFERLHPVSVTR